MMKNINQTIGQSIYTLIAILEDAKNGYLDAAEKIKDDVLSILLENFGYERGRYCNELRQLAKRLDLKSSVDQFTLSLLHRTWMDLKGLFRFGQKDGVLKVCIISEEKAIENYTTAINQLQDNDAVKVVLEQQAESMKKKLNAIKAYSTKPIDNLHHLLNICKV